MSREIKFRGKRNNGEWDFGYFIASEKGAWITDNYYGIHHEVIPSSVGEFTGLKDKRGLQIFEGDIVRVTEYNSK